MSKSIRNDEKKGLRNAMKNMISMIKQDQDLAATLRDQTEQANKERKAQVGSKEGPNLDQLYQDAFKDKAARCTMDRAQSVPDLKPGKHMDQSIQMHKSAIEVRKNYDNVQGVFKEYQKMLFEKWDQQQAEITKAHLAANAKKKKKLEQVNLTSKFANPLYGCKILPHNTANFLQKCKKFNSTGNLHNSNSRNNVPQSLQPKSEYNREDIVSNTTDKVLEQQQNSLSSNNLKNKLSQADSIKYIENSSPLKSNHSKDHFIQPPQSTNDSKDQQNMTNNTNKRHQKLIAEIDRDYQREMHETREARAKLQDKSPMERKEEMKRLHEDYLLEQKIVSEITNKMKDFRFVDSLKKKGLPEDQIQDLQNEDKVKEKLRTHGKHGFLKSLTSTYASGPSEPFNHIGVSKALNLHKVEVKVNLKDYLKNNMLESLSKNQNENLNMTGMVGTQKVVVDKKFGVWQEEDFKPKKVKAYEHKKQADKHSLKGSTVSLRKNAETEETLREFNSISHQIDELEVIRTTECPILHDAMDNKDVPLMNGDAFDIILDKQTNSLQFNQGLSNWQQRIQEEVEHVKKVLGNIEDKKERHKYINGVTLEEDALVRFSKLLINSKRLFIVDKFLDAINTALKAYEEVEHNTTMGKVERMRRLQDVAEKRLRFENIFRILKEKEKSDTKISNRASIVQLEKLKLEEGDIQYQDKLVKRQDEVDFRKEKILEHLKDQVQSMKVDDSIFDQVHESKRERKERLKRKAEGRETQQDKLIDEKIQRQEQDKKTRDQTQKDNRQAIQLFRADKDEETESQIDKKFQNFSEFANQQMFTLNENLRKQFQRQSCETDLISKRMVFGRQKLQTERQEDANTNNFIRSNDADMARDFHDTQDDAHHTMLTRQQLDIHLDFQDLKLTRNQQDITKFDNYLQYKEQLSIDKYSTLKEYYNFKDEARIEHFENMIRMRVLDRARFIYPNGVNLQKLCNNHAADPKKMNETKQSFVRRDSFQNSVVDKDDIKSTIKKHEKVQLNYNQEVFNLINGEEWPAPLHTYETWEEQTKIFNKEFAKWGNQYFSQSFNMEEIIGKQLEEHVQKNVDMKAKSGQKFLTLKDLKSQKNSIFIDPMNHMQQIVIQLFAKRVLHCQIEIQDQKGHIFSRMQMCANMTIKLFRKYYFKIKNQGSEPVRFQVQYSATETQAKEKNIIKEVIPHPVYRDGCAKDYHEMIEEQLRKENVSAERGDDAPQADQQTIDKHVILFCGNNTDDSLMCNKLINYLYKKELHEEYSILFVSQHESEDEFSKFISDHSDYWYIDYGSVLKSNICYELDLHAPSFLIFNKYTKQKNGIDGLKLFHIKDKDDVDLERLENQPDNTPEKSKYKQNYKTFLSKIQDHKQ